MHFLLFLVFMIRQVNRTSTLTWTLVKFACLRDVSFAQSGSLADGGTDAVYVVPWENGVQENPSVIPKRKKEWKSQQNES